MHGKHIILTTGIALIVLTAAASPSVYFYRKYKQVEKIAQSGGAVSSEETKKIIAEVAALIDLPANETPTIVPITDVQNLSDQPFFSKAKNGDMLLVYNTAKKAILYDPLRKKIIEVGPVFTTTPTPTESIASGSAAPSSSSSSSSSSATQPSPSAAPN